MSYKFSSRKKKYLSAHNSFEKLEIDNNLFEWVEHKLRIWEYIRFSCYIKYRAILGLNDEIDNQRNTSSISLIKTFKIFKNYFLSLFLFLLPKKSPIVVFGVSRRTKVNNFWVDQHTDYLINYLPKNTLYIEENFYHNHYQPQPQARRINWDFVSYTSSILSRLFSKFLILSKKGKNNLFLINKLINTFDQKLLKYVILYSKVSSFLTRIFIKIKGVKVCILVPAYGKESLIEALKKEKVKVIELQHGSITPKHYGYSYPTDFPKINSPDVLFSYGLYWKRNIEKYMSNTEIIILGSYEFTTKMRNLKASINFNNKINSSKRILIISQSRNANFFKKIYQIIRYKISNNVDIVYRPHPREKLSLSQKKFYSKIDNIYEDISSSQIIIGAYSTALYEALAMGTNVVVLDIEGASNFKSLLKYENLFIAEDQNSLINHINNKLISFEDKNNNQKVADGSYIYAKFDKVKLLDVIENSQYS